MKAKVLVSPSRRTYVLDDNHDSPGVRQHGRARVRQSPLPTITADKGKSEVTRK